MGHLLGYARVSTVDQQPHLQVDALEGAGCYRVFTETASGARCDRPTLEQLLDQLRPGDTLLAWKLDRLGGRCATWSTPSLGLPNVASGSAACRRRSTPPRLAASRQRPLSALPPVSLSAGTV
jgi:Resolvase, N terminal domain